MLLSPQIANKYDEDVRRSLRFVLARCYIGDWFVLYQLLKNTNHYFYKWEPHDVLKKKKQINNAPTFAIFYPGTSSRNWGMIWSGPPSSRGRRAREPRRRGAKTASKCKGWQEGGGHKLGFGHGNSEDQITIRSMDHEMIQVGRSRRDTGWKVHNHDRMK